MTTPWTQRYAQRTHTLTSSIIRELLKLAQQPDVISFGGGLPAPEFFPAAQIQQACERTLNEHGSFALQYSTTEGYQPLREMIARHVARYGIHATADNVLITSGSQQALDLIAKLLINPGDRILVEAPTYLGALQAFNVFGAEYVSVPTDVDGLHTAHLEDALRTGPKFMYILPNFHNPGGFTLAEDRRKELVRLADKYGTPIVEDDPYGQLRYEGEHIKPLFVLDRMTRGIRPDTGFRLGNVIYLSTFSKTLTPGLRLGWVIAPTDVITKLVQLKQGADLHTSTFTQVVAYETARGGFLDQHIKLLREVYRDRRDVMLTALAERFPKNVTWTRPTGGLFVWMRLPVGMDSHIFLEAALTRKVAFVPGDAFFAPDVPVAEARRYLRLNFSSTPPERIRLGIARLAEAFAALPQPNAEYAAEKQNGQLAVPALFG
jgi:2-aminoadipate transaminase